MTNSEKGKERRMRVVVAAIGAAIVFATFVVKDNWRDDAKGLEDAINNAENAFVIRTENFRNFAELRSFEKQFQEFRHNPTYQMILIPRGQTWDYPSMHRRQ
jgi:hypothetical protein